MLLVILAAASFWAGAQNALAGGGSFVTFPALLLLGLDPRAANITSTVALFPGQIATGWTGRGFVSGLSGASFRALCGVSLAGGAVGALLLLATPPDFFARLVPFLVLFATAAFIWGNFLRKTGNAATPIPATWSLAMQALIATYGGYFGGGMGMMLMAALTLGGMAVRQAGATKNAVTAVINAAAVTIFAFSSDVHWWPAAVVAVAALAGGQAGTWLMLRVNEQLLRVAVAVIGLTLTLAMFWRAFGR